jgi:hypothetical protein
MKRSKSNLPAVSGSLWTTENRSDPKKLKKAQVEKLIKLARDGRRRLADRVWAANQLSDHGIEFGANIIPGYATPREGLKELLTVEGGCVAIAEARKRFQRPWLASQIKKGEVLAFRGRYGRVQVPVWQFTPDGEDLIDGMAAVIRAARKAPGKDLSVFCFMLQPSPMLELRTPLEALRNGETKRVIAAAVDQARGP